MPLYHAAQNCQPMVLAKLWKGYKGRCRSLYGLRIAYPQLFERECRAARLDERRQLGENPSGFQSYLGTSPAQPPNKTFVWNQARYGYHFVCTAADATINKSKRQLTASGILGLHSRHGHHRCSPLTNIECFNGHAEKTSILRPFYCCCPHGQAIGNETASGRLEATKTGVSACAA